MEHHMPSKKKTKKKPTKKAKKAKTAKKPMNKPKQAAAPSRNTPADGSAAPDFALPGDDGRVHKLSDHRGQPVVLYFYPKDDTSGCTAEACDFRDNLARATSKGAVVYGVSKDSLKSHDKFKQKYQLNFTLLSDESLDVHKRYGAWGEKLMYGKPMIGVIRSTFLIDRHGKIARSWPRVKVEGHVADVLDALDRL
jgi:peroxiredoxin Q/BCP